ncbi:hypothetical protein SAMN04488528_1001131 [Clostridium frigidicarnis]|uniref:Uncharacterized protein n=1 Tax=Clostridium frigidicarnis TaxID=84698 RepID=A0A1I0V3D5_9CLOT|nr:hypothetical protein SAMN04488528_1001131 [Clostridium frigidicarnis]
MKVINLNKYKANKELEKAYKNLLKTKLGGK